MYLPEAGPLTRSARGFSIHSAGPSPPEFFCCRSPRPRHSFTADKDLPGQVRSYISPRLRSRRLGRQVRFVLPYSASKWSCVMNADEQLMALADHLQAERSRILLSWQESVAHDPELTTSSTISRTQFNDHIPQVLEAFEHRLRAKEPSEKRQAREEQRENAAVHGLHRWQQGYDQREAMREWGHLHICILRELERYEGEHKQTRES